MVEERKLDYQSKQRATRRVQRGGTMALPHFFVGAAALALGAVLGHFLDGALFWILVPAAYLTALVCMFAGVIGAIIDVIAMRGRGLSLLTLLLRLILEAAFAIYTWDILRQPLFAPGG